MDNTKHKEDKRSETIIANLLRYGVWIAFWICVIGSLITLLTTHPSHSMFETQAKPTAFSFVEFSTKLIQLDASQLSLLGIILLLLTPLLRVVFALILYIQQKNILYVVITSSVLLILAISILIGALL